MPGQDWNHLGAVIKHDRRRARMSQADLAQAAGLSTRTVGNYERGRVPETAPVVPDGYYDIASVLGWARSSIEVILAGGEPEPAGAVGRSVSQDDVNTLAAPALRLADMARDMGAPQDLVDRYRLTTVSLAGWMSSKAATSQSTVGLAAYRPHALGEGVAPDDAERILKAFEDGK
ncbi:helix-turn-helix transcriptional regulator [Streptomyces sp. NPDC127040]|uniref:helix-turn-helix transcriptional regulator n=1 Tax=Streptomyces sp. NPDC127040 TaxID=3347116 RepID=UPI003664FD76